jgi:hypothetical protein
MPTADTAPQNYASHSTNDLPDNNNDGARHFDNGGMVVETAASGGDSSSASIYPAMGCGIISDDTTHDYGPGKSDNSPHVSDRNLGPAADNDDHYHQQRMEHEDIGPQPFTVRAWRKVPFEGEVLDARSAAPPMSRLAQRMAVFASAKLDDDGVKPLTRHANDQHRGGRYSEDYVGDEEPGTPISGHRATSSVSSIPPNLDSASPAGPITPTLALGRRRRTSSATGPTQTTRSRRGSSSIVFGGITNNSSDTGAGFGAGSASASATPLNRATKPLSMTPAAISMRRKRARDRLAKAMAAEEKARRDAAGGGAGGEDGQGQVAAGAASAGEVRATGLASDDTEEDPDLKNYHADGDGDGNGNDDDNDDGEDSVVADHPPDEDYVQPSRSRSSRKRAASGSSARGAKRAASSVRARRSRAA